VKNEYSIVSIVSLVALVGLVLTIGGEGSSGAFSAYKVDPEFSARVNPELQETRSGLTQQIPEAECKWEYGLKGYYAYNVFTKDFESCGSIGGFNRGAPKEILEGGFEARTFADSRSNVGIGSTGKQFNINPEFQEQSEELEKIYYVQVDSPGQVAWAEEAQAGR